jgi:outer membrane protein assembly factor BamB
MTTAPIDGVSSRKPLRLWPGVAAAVLLCLVRFIVPVVVPGGGVIGMIGALVCALAILLWWLFFSRALWSERVGALVFMAVALLATSPLVDASITNGMMGNMLPVFATPLLFLALVVSMAASRHLSSGRRRGAMVIAILLACAASTLVRTGGVNGDGDADLHWRWTPTPEQRLLARAAGDESAVRASTPAPVAAATPEKPVAPTSAPTAAKVDLAAPATAETSAAPATSERAVRRIEWPGFRGPERDGVIRGIQIATDWSQAPPVELWRRPIGPGWSSFAVRGDVLYTQEQRGDEELISAYSVKTGAPMWRHRDAARFWESNAGPGPRGTPTLSGDRLYALGATGIVNALNARDGSVVWSRNAQADTGAPMPGWGFTSSPLVVNDLVIVAASGRLAAYDVATGTPRWFQKTGGGSYSSPHLMTIGGVAQVLLLNGTGAISVAPADGTVLWNHEWAGAPILQPAPTSDGNVLITTGDMMGGVGMRRIAVTRGPGGWTAEERWTSRGLKPYFNDFVVHEGHAFGFDGSILACIDLEDGTRKWKGGRYGHGQLVLLPDQDLLLVLSEEGELALVKAAPDQFTEVARFKAVEGKTWNHPVLAGDVLLVRNGEEMAAFRLSRAGS